MSHIVRTSFSDTQQEHIPEETSTLTTHELKGTKDIPEETFTTTDDQTEQDPYWIKDLNLKVSDKNILLQNKELNDRLMDAASSLLKQSTLLLNNSEHWTHLGTNMNSIPLIHQETTAHWIASAMQDQQLYIYDNLQPSLCAQILPDTRRAIKNIFGNDIGQLMFPNKLGLLIVACSPLHFGSQFSKMSEDSLLKVARLNDVTSGYNVK